MKLVYINKVGQNWKGEFIYEFLFSDRVEDIDGEGWDSYPSIGSPEPPEKKFIKEVGSITTNLKLDLIQESASSDLSCSNVDAPYPFFANFIFLLFLFFYFF